jgi:prepilin-type N-terminal cleavage/methylation domain-containing protein
MNRCGIRNPSVPTVLPAATPLPAARRRSRRDRAGFTLVEVLVATALALLLVGVAVNVFALVGNSVASSRAMLETADRLQSAQHRLQTDLRYMTLMGHVHMPVDPATGRGYLEIIEGPGPFIVTGLGTVPLNTEGATPALDSTVGDMDDVLLFTARSFGEPFVGVGGAQSPVAEIAWFTRGTNLYRRVRLVVPGRVVGSPNLGGIAASSDFSWRLEGNDTASGVTTDPRADAPATQRLVSNALGDLTKRECRMNHWPYFWPARPGNTLFNFPHESRDWMSLGMPTLREESDARWTWPFVVPSHPTFAGGIDYWFNGFQWYDVSLDAAGNITGAAPRVHDPQNPNAQPLDPDTGAIRVPDPNDPSQWLVFAGTREWEDVVLSNVIAFDVRVWDDAAPLFSVAGGSELVTPGDRGYRVEFERWIREVLAGGNVTNPPAAFGAYVDMYYTRGFTANNAAERAAMNAVSELSGPGDPRSQLHAATPTMPAVFDTWSSHYESDGLNQDGDGVVDEGTDGVDNLYDPAADPNGTFHPATAGPNLLSTGGVDDETERETAPPYDVHLRGIQIRIRVFERDTRQIREVTVLQDFVS